MCQLRELTEPLPYHPQNLSHLVSWSVERHMESYKVDIPLSDIHQSLVDYVIDCGLDVAAFPFDLIEAPKA